MASWVPALVVVPLAMAGAIVVSQPDDDHPELRRLHPLDRGTTWTYAVYDHDRPSGTRTRHVAGRAGLVDETGLVDAVQLVSRYTDQPGVGPSTTMSYLGQVGPQLLQFGIVADGSSLVLDPPAPAYELPVAEGTSWTYDGTLGTARLSFASTLEEIVDIEVSGRTFHGCAHYVTDFDVELEDGSGDPEHLEEWTCPGFGTVRTISTIEAQDAVVREELIAFHGLDTDWVSSQASVAEPSTSMVAGSTSSLDQARANALPDGALGDRLAWSDARDQQFRFPPAADDEIQVMSDNSGDVVATDVLTGSVRWRLNVAGPVVAPPVVVGDTVLIADAAKTLLAVAADDGSARWLHEFDDQVSAAPTTLDDAVLVPTDDGAVTALALADGSQRWAAGRSAPVRDAPAVTGDTWLVADRAGEVTAYSVDGDEVWSRDLEEELAVGPAVADGLALVGDLAGVVYAIDADDGALVWERRTRTTPTQPLAVGSDTVAVVLAKGRLQALDLATGESRWDERNPDVYAPPVIVGDDVVTVSSRGEVRVRATADGDLADSWQLPLPSDTARLDIDVDPALVGDVLVFGGSVSDNGHTAGLFAYPVTGTEERRGVVLGVDTRTFAATPSDPPAVVGESIWLAATDGALHHQASRSEPEKVHQSGSVQPGAAVGAGLAVTQLDERFVAYPATGGDPVWELPAAAPILGSRPAISDDTVFLPLYQVGLTAAELDGTVRWTTTIPDSFSPTTPLPLPDGDVVFGGAGLARYDGRTGREEWAVPDSALFGHPAYADGVVYADLARDHHPSGLGAFDAATGRQKWHVDNARQLFGGQPAVGGGVVVTADAAGRVFAVDTTDGAPLWEVQLTSVPAGSPVIVDGRVYLYELGRNEDLYQRAVRLSVHDLRTGRLLAAYEPATSTIGSRPAMTAADDGRVVIHAGDDFGSLLLLEPRS